MRAVLVIALLHLRRTARSPGLIALLLAIPVSIALLEYAAFGRTAAAGKLPPIKILILDEDDSIVSRAVPQLFTGGPMKDSFEVAPAGSVEEAARLFRKDEASALVRVPKGFQQRLLDGDEPAVEIYKNPAQTFSPDIVESVLEMGAVIGNGLYAHAREPIARIKEMLDEDREPTTAEIAAISVGFYLASKRMGRLEGLDDLSVDVVRAQGGRSSGGFRGLDPGKFFATIFPGLTLFSLLFISQSLALRLLRDRLKGLQRRLILTPASRGAVLAGGSVYLIAALFLLLVVLALIGSLIFRIALREPAALLVLGSGFAVFAAALQLAVSAHARDDQVAQTVSGVVIILLALAGGTFVNPENLPSFFKTLSRVVPNGAVQQGFVDLLVHERSFADVTRAAGTVWLWAAGLMTYALAAERRRLTR